MIANRRCASSSVSDEVGSSKASSRHAGAEGAHDLDQLALRRPERRGRAARLQRRSSPNRASMAARPPLQIGPVDEHRAARLEVADEDVLGDRSSGMISGSWWMMRMPASCASRAEAKATCWPSTSDAALVGREARPRACASGSTCRPRSRRPAPSPRRRQVEAHPLERLDHAEPLGDAGDGASRASRHRGEAWRTSASRALQAWLVVGEVVGADQDSGRHVGDHRQRLAVRDAARGAA